MATLEERAVRVLGRRNGVAAWPYGLATPSREHLQTLSADKARESLARAKNAQNSIVRWAERYGFRASDAGCCPNWLKREVSRKCSASQCTRYWNDVRPDAAWLDHAVAWVKDGKPAALTSAPYDVNREFKERINWWLEQDANLRFVRGRGWYGLGTQQLILWRADRIAVIDPA
ncbi:hypothetical protein OG948_25395 [Embleya sp. NBC_00888]|uniref:hypothetical protein n=1 Tax=Embleya sp. NBC_00888 TaxID=2975960 RepID=UPI00386BD187|nr:hypothetical protein OG948_25395 [Embleya sp. NBC_00888]